MEPLTVVDFLAAGAKPEALPVVPRLSGGLLSALTTVRTTGPASPEVIRLWPTGTDIDETILSGRGQRLRKA